VARAECEVDDELYSVTLSKVGELNVQEGSEKGATLQFMNVLLKTMMRELNLFQIGARGKVYDPTRSIKLKDFPFKMIPGYFLSVNSYVGGLQLKIDNCFKILREDTVFTYMKELLDERG
jgi:hypothetical protein